VSESAPTNKLLLNAAYGVIALLALLIATEIVIYRQQCTRGYATIVYDIRTDYIGYASYIVSDPDWYSAWFITGDNEIIRLSVETGAYNIFGYYTNKYQDLSDSLGNTIPDPNEEYIDEYEVIEDIRLCAGDEYHVSAWKSSND